MVKDTLIICFICYLLSAIQFLLLIIIIFIPTNLKKKNFF